MSAVLQPTLFALPEAAPASIGRVAVRVSESTQLLSPGKGRTSDYDFSLNPYRGCGFGCAYCYAAAFVADEAQRAAWGEWVEVKERALATLRRADLRNRRIYMSSATDPYQPIEAEVRLTRRVLEVLLDQQARLVIQTRGPLVTRDIDLLKRFRHLRVNLSITTDDDEARKRYEPACASIERRLDAVRQLKEAGIRVGACISPMLPMRDPAAFGKRLTALRVDAACASWFHRSERAFAASTRPGAFGTLAKDAWTHGDYLRACDALARTCLAFSADAAAFRPV